MRSRQVSFSRDQPNLYLDYIIVIGCVIDWLPSYMQQQITGSDLSAGFVFSATKLLIIPALFLDLILNTRYWVFNHRLFVILGMMAIGLIPPYLFGQSHPVRFVPHFINIIVLFYFLRPRQYAHVKNLLIVTLVCSALVPISQFLAVSGILNPLKETRGGGEGAERVFAVTRTGTLGVYTGIILASLGGMLLGYWNTGFKLLTKQILGFCIVVMALFTPLTTGQRSVMLLAVFTLFVAVLWALKTRLITTTVMIIVAAAIFVVTLPLFFTLIEERFLYIVDRFDRMAIGQSHLTEGSTYYRIAEYQDFFAQIFTSPSLYGPGIYAFYNKFGNVPHSLFGHAYYDGGVMFLALYGIYFYYILKWMIACNPLKLRGDYADTAFVMILICLSIMIYSMFMPLLNDRSIALIGGLMYCVSLSIRLSIIRQHQMILKPRIGSE